MASRIHSWSCTESQILEALEIQGEQGGVIGQILVEMGYITREEILLALAVQMGLESVDLGEMPPLGEPR
ncbi:MAG TPA: hypothetical protein VEN81_15040 [Planctomycetota bacterium]|nr:hypothetical protein [Planctomycetota bacterium]